MTVMLGGCASLGTTYMYGAGVKQNYSKAKEFYKKACDGGEAFGCLQYKELNKR